jgi:hypothetical protein
MLSPVLLPRLLLLPPPPLLTGKSYGSAGGGLARWEVTAVMRSLLFRLPVLDALLRLPPLNGATATAPATTSRDIVPTFDVPPFFFLLLLLPARVLRGGGMPLRCCD